MDEPACPRCKTTKYRNPSLKLLVNVCGHTLCENCVELLFIRGSGTCQECGIALRRNNFRLQLFEDPMVEKEVDIRKKVLKDFNKKEEDFADLREYNDYLEMVETIVFNLTNDVDVEATKKQIELYRKENQDQIRKNRVKLSKDEEYLEILIEQEQRDLEFNRKLAQDEERQQQQTKKKNKEALLDELMFSDLPADHILASHQQTISLQPQETSRPSPPRERRTAFSTGIQLGKQASFVPLSKIEVGEVYEYKAPTFTVYGPPPPDTPALTQTGYLSHIRDVTDSERGGGYLAAYGCKRALQEAFCGLFFSFDNIQQTHSEMSVS